MEINFEYCDGCHELKPHHLLHCVGDKVFCRYSTNDCARKYFEKVGGYVVSQETQTEEAE